jgi:hypothetical protein
VAGWLAGWVGFAKIKRASERASEGKEGQKVYVRVVGERKSGVVARGRRARGGGGGGDETGGGEGWGGDGGGSASGGGALSAPCRTS